MTHNREKMPRTLNISKRPNKGDKVSAPMESCVGKTYDQIWQIFSARHGQSLETKRIHNKWKEIGSQVK